MLSPRRPRAAAPVLVACLVAGALASAACQALPPPASATARAGRVRAATEEDARDVAAALDALLPEVIAEIPDARGRGLEVWVQKEPELYRFPPSSTYRESDGFFSDRLGRIHLRAGADDVRRTLAHELVHACLGPSWRDLPGTIEEGLCDVVATRLCPASAARLRAGRLLAAALALGGLDLECAESQPGQSRPGIHYVQHVFAERRSERIDPLEVFRSHAGRSTATMPGDLKKALYGLAFLVTERIVERRGLEGLHAIVGTTGRGRTAEGEIERLLEAAGLTRDPGDWRRAISEAFGPAEVAEVSRLVPGILVHASEVSPVDERPPAPASVSLDLRCARPRPR